MEWSLRLAYPWVLYIGLPLVIAACAYRYWFRRSLVYRFALTSYIVERTSAPSRFIYRLPVWLRSILLVGLVILTARPQLVDKHSKVQVDGIDIMVVLDVSGSMQLFDDLKDPRTRIDVAKQEAINFIKKRDNDPIGIVLFGNQALSRCPLTLDKSMLVKLVEETQLGLINPDGTMLSRGLVMALNRLKKSESKSKIIIALTDGEPTQGDLDPNIVVQLARKYNVKIYTIGIGNEQGAYVRHPIFGIQMVQSGLNKNLLYGLAQQTGGQFFEVHKPADLATIYDTIDALEKTHYQTDVYHNYYDIFMPFLWALLILAYAESMLGIFLGRLS